MPALKARASPHSGFAYLACAVAVAAFVAVAVAHSARLQDFAGDDRLWLRYAGKGIPGLWHSEAPFGHYRPTFGTWLFVLIQAGVSAPRALALSSLTLNLLLFGVFLWTVTPLLSKEKAAICASLFLVHPVRQEQAFWLSDGTDVISLILSLACIGVVLRKRHATSVGWQAMTFLAIATALAVLSKETALLIPVVVLLFPGLGSLRRRATLMTNCRRCRCC